MEKIIYALKGAASAGIAKCAAGLKSAGAQSVRINLFDADVEPAAALAQMRGATLPDMIVQCWVPSSNPLMRGAVDSVVDDLSNDWSAWLVCESTIIENEKHPAPSGARTDGFSQMAFLTLPDGMSWDAWRAVWRDSHTQIAIDTQSNFEYRQNLVVEPLTNNAAPFVAIVEECFPAEAMSDPLVFFDAVDDQAKFDRNLKIMMDSCARFITPGTIDVIPTSQYTFD